MDFPSRQDGPRAFRSRRDRPCDACRSRKIACRIESAPPCAFCLNRGGACTFQNGPSNKRRRQPSSSSESLTNSHGHQLEIYSSLPHGWDDFDTEAFDSAIFDGLELAEVESPSSSIQTNNSQPQVANGRPLSTTFHQTRQPSLRTASGNLRSHDASLLCRSQIPPDTGHLNRHVMLELMNQKDSMEVSQIRLSRLQPSRSEFPAINKQTPIFMVRDDAPFLKNGSEATGHASWADIESLLCAKQRHELTQLFFHFVQPAFPVLHHQTKADSDTRLNNTLSTMSLALSACVYATALPFSIHNDYLNATLTDVSGKREKLYSVAVAAMLEETNSPSVETLQTCLLLLQKGPTIQHQGLTPTYSWLASLAVTIAKCLGLQHDCSMWDIPASEKQLRTRLWWATFIMDLWVSIDTPGGRSICSQDYDVQVETSRDEMTGNTTGGTETPHFGCLVDLSLLLSQIYETYYTIRAANDTADDLVKSLERARSLRSALSECKQNLKSVIPLDGDGNADTSASVHLAGCITSVILFRALLRPVRSIQLKAASSTDTHFSAAAAVMTGSINCAREAVELLENMVKMVGPWNEFWHSWSQGNFAIVSTFLVQLMLMTRSEESARLEIMDLVSRWKRAIRIGAGSGGWGSSLMNMALSRLDSLLSYAVA